MKKALKVAGIQSHSLVSGLLSQENIDDGRLNTSYSFWFDANVPVNNCSVMLGRSHRFLGITSIFGG